MDKIILNDGEKDIEFVLLDTFGVDDKEYAVFHNEEENQIYILQVIMEGEEVLFQSIENPKELDEILSFYLELLDEDVEEQ